VLAARKERYAKCLMYNWWQSVHLEIVGLPLAMLKIANGDVRQAAVGGTNIGRDADTNAGRAAGRCTPWRCTRAERMDSDVQAVGPGTHPAPRQGHGRVRRR
jgi:hypothetical protein